MDRSVVLGILSIAGSVMIACISGYVAVRIAQRSTRVGNDPTLATLTFWRENSAALERRVGELETRVRQLETEMHEKDSTIARLVGENQRLAARRAGT